MRTRLSMAVLAMLSPPALAAQEGRLTDIGPFLMDRHEEVALARTAAPHDLGAAASVWVLTRDGYVEAARGSNGFACFVGRGWSGPILSGPGSARRVNPDVLDPAVRAPHCFNSAAAASILPWQAARTRLLIEGVPAMDVDARLEAELKAGRLKPPAPGAMAYMMSSRQDLGPAFGAWRPHVMVYLAGLRGEDWGVPRFTHDFPTVVESGSPWAVVVIPMRAFSDGSMAPEHVTGRQR